MTKYEENYFCDFIYRQKKAWVMLIINVTGD